MKGTTRVVGSTSDHRETDELVSSQDPTITELLNRLRHDIDGTLPELLPLICDDLRRIARCHLRGGLVREELQTTMLVDDYLLSVLGAATVHWEDREHFFSQAAMVMRRTTIDCLRKLGAEKRGGQFLIISLLDEVEIASTRLSPRVDVLDLHDALEKLAELDAEACRMIEYRYFLGFTIEETAELMKLPRATMMRRWASTRLWLLRALSNAAGETPRGG